jgi:hypothetical protein
MLTFLTSYVFYFLIFSHLLPKQRNFISRGGTNNNKYEREENHDNHINTHNFLQMKTKSKILKINKLCWFRVKFSYLAFTSFHSQFFIYMKKKRL